MVNIILVMSLLIGVLESLNAMERLSINYITVIILLNQNVYQCLVVVWMKEIYLEKLLKQWLNGNRQIQLLMNVFTK